MNIYKVTCDGGYRYYKCANITYLLYNLEQSGFAVSKITEIKLINKLPSDKEIYREYK